MPVDTFLQPRQVADAVAALLTMDDDVVPQELISNEWVFRALQDTKARGPAPEERSRGRLFVTLLRLRLQDRVPAVSGRHPG